MRAILYIMISMDEVKQDLQVQLDDLRRLSKANRWDFDEIFEYCRHMGDQPKLREVMGHISKKRYSILVVHSLAKFNQEHPNKTYELLSLIVDAYQCRFISLFEGIDSQDSPSWNKTKRLFAYFAHMPSSNQSIKVENGLKDTKDYEKRSGGRPQKIIDPVRLRDSIRTGLTVRRAVEIYNDGLPRESRISKTKMAKVMAAQGT